VIGIIIIVLLLVFFRRVDVFILVFVLCVIAFHKAYVAMLWRLCITVNRESVSVEEIKEVELRSRRAQFMTEIIIETRSCI